MQKRKLYEINGILKRKNGECAACLKYSVLIFVE
jgi:ribosomal protein S27AE